jgi:hypothetical protein
MIVSRTAIIFVWSAVLFLWSNPGQAQCECFCVNGKWQSICKGGGSLVCPATSCGLSHSDPDPGPKPSPSPSSLSGVAQRAAYCSAVLSAVIAATPENHQVTGPDGRVFKFPGNTPKEIIESRLIRLKLSAITDGTHCEA